MEWLQAAGVVLAIVISLVTYVLTNRRDDKKWQRDQLLEATVRVLDGSFACYSGRAFAMRRRLLLPENLYEGRYDEKVFDRYRARAQAGHHDQNQALTRLRLLAPVEVVRAAEELAAADRFVERWFDDPDLEYYTWGDLSGERREMRTAFIESYRRSFKLGKGKSIESGGFTQF